MKRIFLFLLIVAATGLQGRAQVFSAGLKVGYDFTSSDVATEFRDAYNDLSIKLLKRCDVGLMARLNLGRFIVQPEASFGINSIWDDVAAQTNTLDKIQTCFADIQTVDVAVPVLVGYKIIDWDDNFCLKLFAGPEFHTTFGQAVESHSINISNFKLLGGVGFDFFSTLSVDMYYKVPFDDLPSTSQARMVLSAGLFL